MQMEKVGGRPRAQNVLAVVGIILNYRWQTI